MQHGSLRPSCPNQSVFRELRTERHTAVRIPLFPFPVAYLHTARLRVAIAAPFVSSPLLRPPLPNRCVYFSKASPPSAVRPSVVRGGRLVGRVLLAGERMNEGREGELPHTRARGRGRTRPVRPGKCGAKNG